MATSGTGADWYGDRGSVNRLGGRAFRAVCLAATSFALVSVLILLLYVAVDAFRPFSADPGWHLVYFLTLVIPAGSLAVFLYRTEEPAGEVAYATTGIPVVGVLVSAGTLILLVEIVSVQELFAAAVAIGVAVAAITVHGYLRPTVALERLAVLIGAPVVSLLGLPPAEVVTALNWGAAQLGLGVGIGTRVLSLREVTLRAPYLPVEWVILLVTLTLPVAALFGLLLAGRRKSRRDGAVFVALSLAGAGLGTVIGPLVGLGTTVWIVLVTFTLPPLAVYVEGVLRRDEGIAGLTFPLVLIGGVLLGAVLVRQFGFAPPDLWLDFDYLTNAHSRFDPRDAGIYPALVGSVMMLVVIILTTFPVGVGAAIYLEEYAPSSGWGGHVVTFIEINIGNLAGVPSVVYGLLGLALFIRTMHMPTGTVMVGALAVGLLILPIVIISAQEAIRAVPDSHREASYGMGATRWQTTRRVVLPQAMPGILTGTILALGRAIGETAPLLMIGAAAIVRKPPNGFFDLFTAMPRQIFSWSREFEPAFRHGVLAAGVVTLLAVLLIVNGTAIVIRNRYQRQD